METLKIAVTGPEGSGKTVLATALANYFSCPFIADYSEYFLERNNDKEVTPDDLIKIASGKLEWEKEKLKVDPEPKLVISDGELMLLKIWSEFRFNKYPKDLKELVDRQKYHLYILTKPEDQPKYPFKREEQNLRLYFFNAFKKELDEHDLPYIISEGEFYFRKKHAVNEIERLLKSSF